MNNKFWREVFDQIHALVLVYRLEDAGPQLMFVNQAVVRMLGYQPESYVMESEQDGPLRDELTRLYSQLANGSALVELTSLSGVNVPFQGIAYEYDSPSLKSTFVVVSLEEPGSGSGSVAESAGSLFVAESTVMRSVLDRVEYLENVQANIVFVGEQGTGKRRFIDGMVTRYAASDRAFWVVDYTSGTAACKADGVQMDFSDLLTQRPKKPIDLFVYELQAMPKADQLLLDQWMASVPQTFRFIAGSSISPDDLVARGRLNGELYYRMAANSVVLPPLQLRRADIRPYAHAWLARMEANSGVEAPDFSDKEWDRLFHHEWQRHFDELNEILLRSFMAQKPQRGRFLIELPQEKEKQVSRNGNASFAIDVTRPYDDFMKIYLTEVLEKCGGKVYGKDGAAALLGMKPTTLQSKLLKYGVK